MTVPDPQFGDWDYCYRGGGVPIAGPDGLGGVVWNSDAYVAHRMHLYPHTPTPNPGTGFEGWEDIVLDQWELLVTQPDGSLFGGSVVGIALEPGVPAGESPGACWVSLAADGMPPVDVHSALLNEFPILADQIGTNCPWPMAQLVGDESFTHLIDVQCGQPGTWRVDVFRNGVMVPELCTEFQLGDGPAPDFSGSLSDLACDPCDDPANASLPECQCSCEVTSGGNVVAVAGQTAVYGFEIRNLAERECSYSWEVRQTGLARANLDFPASSGTEHLLALEPRQVEVPFDLALPTGARKEEYRLRLEVRDEFGRACEPQSSERATVRKEEVCVVPSGERPDWLVDWPAGDAGWDCYRTPAGPCHPAHPGNTVAVFSGTPLPVDAQFATRHVRESLTGAVDPCFDAVQAAYPGRQLRCGRMGSFAGADWQVGGDGTFRPDFVGHGSACVDSYRQLGHTQCVATVDQSMSIRCFEGPDQVWIEYSFGELEIGWDAQTIWAIREQSGVPAETLPHKVYP